MTETVKAVAVAPLVTKLHITPNTAATAFSQQLVDLMMAGTTSPGCWSAEIIAPHMSDQYDWLLVQRYHTAEQTTAWKQSPNRAQLMEALAKSCDDAGDKTITIVDDAPDLVAQNSVASAITTDVKHGMLDAYRAWETKAQVAQANFPGYRGAFLQPPLPSHPDQWTTILRFDGPTSLDKWFGCAERQKLLPEAKDFVKATAIKALPNSFPGWVPADESGRTPANWQTCLLVLLGLFPIVMCEIKFLAPQLKMLNPDVANFFSLAISVFGVSYITMPQFIKLFSWWLYPAEEAPPSNMAKGMAMIAAIACLEMALFWNLLL